MLDEQDNVILIDFGISQGYTASGERTTVFSTRGVSKGYSAPEYGKEDSFSPALDVYSLGATLYRLSTGDLPPDIQDVEQLTFPDFVSSRMKSIIKEAMHHCVDRRSSLEDLRYSLLSLMTSSDFSQSNDTNETEVDIIASKDSKWEVVKSFVQDIYNSRKLMSLFKNDALGFLMFFGFYCGIFYCINYDQIDPPLGHLFYIQITLLTLVMPVKHYVWLLYKCLFDTHIRDFSRLDWAYLIWVCILLIGYISMIYIFAFDSLILLYKMLSQMCVYLYNKYLC